MTLARLEVYPSQYGFHHGRVQVHMSVFHQATVVGRTIADNVTIHVEDTTLFSQSTIDWQRAGLIIGDSEYNSYSSGLMTNFAVVLSRGLRPPRLRWWWPRGPGRSGDTAAACDWLACDAALLSADDSVAKSGDAATAAAALRRAAMRRVAAASDPLWVPRGGFLPTRSPSMVTVSSQRCFP